MKTLFGIILICGLGISAAQANTNINFDDFSFPGGEPTAARFLPEGYQGFDWSGGAGEFSWAVSPNDATGWIGGAPQPFAHSGNVFSWSSAGTGLEITAHNGGTFDLSSFWARTWQDQNTTITVHGYLGANEIATQTVSLSSQYTQVVLNFNQISRFSIDQQVANVLIDDINVANPSAVPVPAAVWLFVTAVGILGLVQRRSKA